MIPAYSLAKLQEAIDNSLGMKVQRIQKRVPVMELGLMVPGRTPSPRYETKVVEERTEQWSKLVGVLVCSPTSKLGKEEVLPNLEYFHYRSGLFVDFFCIGYGAYWPKNDDGKEPPQSVAKVNNVPWLFGAREFDACRQELENMTRWTFSGETDLLLAVARKNKDTPARIDFSTAISCNIEEMLRDGAITSVRAFFEKIFQFGEQFKGTDPVWKLSDKMGVAIGGNFLIEAILSLVPEASRKSYKSAKHFAVRDVSR